MSDVTVTFTRTEFERLTTIIACHVDLNIQPQLNDAMKKQAESEVARLMAVKAGDMAILEKLREADRNVRN